MTRKIGRSHWWDWPLKIILWIFILGIVYIASLIWKANYPNKGTDWELWAFLGGMGLIYGFNVLGEKLNAILWKLEDIERRLPSDRE